MIIWILKNHKSLINEVATLRWEEWYKWNNKWILFEDILLETIKYSWSIYVSLNNNTLNWFGWIFDDSGIAKKLDWYWLKSLYVKEEFRKKWIWKKIINKIKKEIISRKTNLYLYDMSWIEWFYEKHWFKFIEKYLFNKRTYLIYSL